VTVWALSDVHLSFADAKPMHVFGENWRCHWEKIERAWRASVGPEDVVLVSGDISFARRFRHAARDLDWLDGLPGALKLIVRGNHDHWWPGSTEERARLPRTLHLLEGSAIEAGGEVFCGTGGWLAPQDPYFEPLDRPSYDRELAALRGALEAGAALARGRNLHVVIHFPPYSSSGVPTAFDRLLREYRVRSVTFGHYHLREEWDKAPQGWIGGIHYSLASADFLDFTPQRLPI